MKSRGVKDVIQRDLVQFNNFDKEVRDMRGEARRGEETDERDCC